MSRVKLLCMGTWVVVWSTLCAANTIAVTEFMCDPLGPTEGRQWIELYNYGDAPVKLNGWRLAHDTVPGGAGEVADLPETTVFPGGFVIVVLGPLNMPGRDKKAMFETEWLGGKSDDRVHGVANAPFVLDRNADQIVIRDNRRQVAWALAYKKDGKTGHATHFVGPKFFPKTYGNKTKPGVNRQGNDLDVTGSELLGYESNHATPDPLAIESKVDGLEAEGGDRYTSVAKGGSCGPGTGSPLKGEYKK